MNVQQLIQELQKHPPEMRVIVKGYEAGYHDLSAPEVIPIRLNVHNPKEWYYGPHEDAADRSWKNTGNGTETALLILRHQRTHK